MNQSVPALLALPSGSSAPLFQPPSDTSRAGGADILIVVARVDTESVRARCRGLCRNGWVVVLVAGDKQVDQAVWIVRWVAERAIEFGSASGLVRVTAADESARRSLHRIGRVFPEGGWPPVRLLLDTMPAPRVGRSLLHEEEAR